MSLPVETFDQIAFVLYGPSKATQNYYLSAKLNVSDRTIRRWRTNRERIPPNVFRELLLALKITRDACDRLVEIIETRD